jgi:hypothetical protein
MPKEGSVWQGNEGWLGKNMPKNKILGALCNTFMHASMKPIHVHLQPPAIPHRLSVLARRAVLDKGLQRQMCANYQAVDIVQLQEISAQCLADGVKIRYHKDQRYDELMPEHIMFDRARSRSRVFDGTSLFNLAQLLTLAVGMMKMSEWRLVYAALSRGVCNTGNIPTSILAMWSRLDAQYIQYQKYRDAMRSLIRKELNDLMRFELVQLNETKFIDELVEVGFRFDMFCAVYERVAFSQSPTECPLSTRMLHNCGMHWLFDNHYASPTAYLDSPMRNTMQRSRQPTECDCEARGYVCECTKFTEKLLEWGRSFADVYGSTTRTLKPWNMDTMFAEFVSILKRYAVLRMHNILEFWEPVIREEQRSMIVQSELPARNSYDFNDTLKKRLERAWWRHDQSTRFITKLVDDTGSMNTLEYESEQYFAGVWRELEKNENYRYWSQHGLHDWLHKRAINECVTLSTLCCKTPSKRKLEEDDEEKKEAIVPAKRIKRSIFD